MKAVICEKYGPPEVLKMTTVKKPVPRSKEVLVRIRATTANGADTRIRGAVFPSVFKYVVPLALGIGGPRSSVLGVELAGEVEAVGGDVTKFKPGDRVFASTGASFGAYAEYKCLPETAEMAVMPRNMTFEEAAAVPHCALTALYYLRKGGVRPGTDVMIYGASGGIGTFAVQLAKIMGADVTGVCSTDNVGLVKDLGADRVIDYRTGSVGDCGRAFDLIFDTVGKSPITACAGLVKRGGQYLSAVHLELSRIIAGRKAARRHGITVAGGMAAFSAENLEHLRSLIEAEKLRSVIDRTYGFDGIAAAHRYVDTGHKRGHVAVTVAA